MKRLRNRLLVTLRGYSGNRPSETVRGADPTWLGPAHRRQLLCFVHIPKCAGTSFKTVLWNVYGRNFITYHKHLSQYAPQEMTQDEARGILALSGHLPYGYHEMFGTRTSPRGVFGDREVIYVSIVRNPVDRLLSMARFVRSFPEHRLYEATRKMSFEQFFDYARTEMPGIVGNLQASLLTAGHPREAIAFAEKNYLAVSTIENVDAMIAALAERLGWPEVRIEKKNKSPSKMTDDGHRAVVEQFCRENCKLDIALYEHIAAQPEGFVIRDA